MLGTVRKDLTELQDMLVAT